MSEPVNRWYGGAKDLAQRLGCAPLVCRPYQLTLCCCHSSQTFQARRDQFLIVDALQDQKALLVEVTGRHEAALHRGNARQSHEGFGHACLIPRLLERNPALLEEITCLCLLSLLERELP